MKKKVAFIILGLDYSGAEIVLDKFISKNKKIDPYFILIYKNIQIENILINKYGDNKIFPINLKHSKNKLRYIPFIESQRIVKNINEIIKRINIDLIYCNNTLETMLIGINSKKYSVPIIGHIHDMSYSIKSPIKKYFINKSIKNINTSITVSKACQNSWNSVDTVIYNGIEENYFSDYHRRSINNIAYVGALSQRKGFDIFIKFAERILSSYTEKKIHIIYSDTSNNDQMDCLKKILDKYPNRVIIKQNLNRDDIIKAYDEIDLLCVPSRNDPFPTVVLEAMARGCIVIGSNIDGLPELLNKKSELLFNNEDIDDMISKFESIINLNEHKIQKISKELNCLCKDKFKNSNKVDRINLIINELE